MWMKTSHFESGRPASSTSTLVVGSAESRLASAEPAEPPPTMRKSTTLTSHVRVGGRGLFAVDPLVQLVVDPVVDRRCLVLAEHALPLRVRAHRRVLRPFGLPALEALVIGGRGAEERGLEVRERVRVAEEVRAGLVREERVERLPV